MKDFKYFLKICKLENKGKEERNDKFVNISLNNMMDYIENERKKQPNITNKEIIDDINSEFQNYLSEISHTEIVPRIVEYYLKNKIYSNEINIKNIYNDIVKEQRCSKTDFKDIDESDLKYSCNLKKTARNLTLLIMKKIKAKQEKLQNIENVDRVMELLEKMSSKQRKTCINRICKTPEMKKSIIDTFNQYHRSDYELLQEEFSKCMNDASKLATEDCIKNITKSVELLDKFGYMKQFITLNNKLFMNDLYIFNANYSYEEVMNMFKAENLKKLDLNALVLMSAFWINRVNKVVKDLNKTIFILNDKNLDEIKQGTTEEYRKAMILKTDVLHKMCFELFDDIFNSDRVNDIDEQDEDNVEKNNSNDKKGLVDIFDDVTKICEKYGKEYKEYFDKILPDSENNLYEDIALANVLENIRYNSYKVKDYNMQALLMCLCNSDSKKIENFGYINEPGDKKEILVGADLKGFNMPFALHINKDIILDFLQESQDTSLFPVYKGGEDFIRSNGRIIKAQIFIPLIDKCEKAIQSCAQKWTSNDRNSRAIKHINYLTSTGKMPEHIMEKRNKKGKLAFKYTRDYIDLKEADVNEMFIDR